MHRAQKMLYIDVHEKPQKNGTFHAAFCVSGTYFSHPLGFFAYQRYGLTRSFSWS